MKTLPDFTRPKRASSIPCWVDGGAAASAPLAKTFFYLPTPIPPQVLVCDEDEDLFELLV